jgi:hypothetical protein
VKLNNMSWKEFFCWPLEMIRTIFTRIVRAIRCLVCILFDVKQCKCGTVKQENYTYKKNG